MDFRFDADELGLFQQAARTMSTQLSPRRYLDDAPKRSGWVAIARDGWVHAGLAEAIGGGGLSLPTVAGLAREAGRLIAGDGFVNNAVLIPSLLVAAQRTGALDEHVAHPGFLVCDGRSTDLHGSPSGSTPWCFGVESGLDAYVLSQDGTFLRYDSAAWSVDPTGVLALGVGTVHIAEDAVPLELGTVDEFSSVATINAQILHAAALTGLGEKALQETVNYVLLREQFGGVIGRFQAVKHGLANVAVKLEVAWNSTLYASLRVTAAAAATALLQAGIAADEAVRAMTQFHGGVAITMEHPTHLYLKTAETGRWRFGAADDHALRIALSALGLEDSA